MFHDPARPPSPLRVDFACSPLNLIGKGSDHLRRCRVGNLRSQFTASNDLLLNPDQQFKVIFHGHGNGAQAGMFPALLGSVPERADFAVALTSLLSFDSVPNCENGPLVVKRGITPPHVVVCPAFEE
jgi:hypothetical protein